jgi:putative transposase
LDHHAFARLRSPGTARRGSRLRNSRQQEEAVRAECLDWLLIVNRSHLERVLRVFAGHYNSHRPHRALNLKPPDPAARKQVMHSPTNLVERRDRLGGLIHEYRLAA